MYDYGYDAQCVKQWSLQQYLKVYSYELMKCKFLKCIVLSGESIDVIGYKVYHVLLDAIQKAPVKVTGRIKCGAQYHMTLETQVI